MPNAWCLLGPHGQYHEVHLSHHEVCQSLESLCRAKLRGRYRKKVPSVAYSLEKAAAAEETEGHLLSYLENYRTPNLIPVLVAAFAADEPGRLPWLIQPMNC